MPTNQKYSTRVHSKRQLTRASDNLRAASLVLCEMASRYEEALPVVAAGCRELVEMISMCENMVRDIRENI